MSDNKLTNLEHWSYRCAAHPVRYATALCTRCGALLCRECQCALGSNTVCERCIPTNVSPEKLFESDILKYVKEKKQREIRIQREAFVAKSLKDIPKILWELFRRPSEFLVRTTESKGSVSFCFALVCLFLGLIYRNYTLTSSNIQSIPEYADFTPLQYFLALFISTAFLSVLVIGFVDILLFSVYNIVAQKRIKFSKFATVLNYSFAPFLIAAIPWGGNAPLLISIGLWFALAWHAIRLGLKMRFGKAFLVILPAVVLFIILSQ